MGFAAAFGRRKTHLGNPLPSSAAEGERERGGGRGWGEGVTE
jgi:hypothetical protein